MNEEINSLKKLMEDRQRLDAQITQARESARADELAEARKLIAMFELTPEELGLRPAGKVKSPAGAKPTSTVAPRYRDPESGTTWSGRGKPPRWIAGKDRALFAL